MKADDLFVPRPKLSWRMRVIQGGAFLAALSISLCFFAWDMLVIGRRPSGGGPAFWQQIIAVLPDLLTTAALQILFLVPCWRCYLLRRWACGAVTCVALPLSSFSSALTHSPLVAGLLIPIGIVGYCIAEEWPRLKSGF